MCLVYDQLYALPPIYIHIYINIHISIYMYKQIDMKKKIDIIYEHKICIYMYVTNVYNLIGNYKYV
jgi:hypothetical protein